MAYKLIVIFFLLFHSVSYAAMAQTQDKSILVYDSTDRMPEYPGGSDAMNHFLDKKLFYPERAIDAGFSGKVIVRFIVNEDGSLSDITVPKPLGYGLDEEAVRVIELMPKWVPGQKEGKAVKVYYTVPITFSLR